MLILIALVVLGGTSKIERCTAVLIPIAVALYVCLCGTIILTRASMLPSVINEVLEGAFTPRAGGGGIIGAITSMGISEGFARGLLSNEAGTGTSSLAHARSGEGEPYVCGLFGIAEVVFDTSILCTLTGITILITERGSRCGSMSDVLSLFRDCLGGGGMLLCSMAALLFSLSTVFCQYFYGSLCASRLFGRRGRLLYFPVFLVSAAFGMIMPTGRIVTVSDLILLLMSIISCLTLLKSSDRIKALSEHK